MAEGVVHMRDVMRQATLTIRLAGQREFAVRFWVARQLFGLAALVLGCGVAVEHVQIDERDA